MIYSCFDPKAGLYQYYEDQLGHEVNADLPVPALRGNDRIGVASQAAARPFPRGARPTGRGWRARGVIVKCPGGRGTTLGAFESNKSVAGAILLVAVGSAAVYAWRKLA